VIDVRHLSSMGGIESLLVREVVEEFLAELTDERDALSKLLESQDHGALRERLHKFAGAAGMAGFTALWTHLARWERVVVERSAMDPGEWLTVLDVRIAEGRDAWRQAVGEQAGAS